MSRIPKRRAAVAWLALVLAACGSERGGGDARGAGLEVTAMPPDQRAEAYAVALRGAFDVEPGLILLLDPALLPRDRAEGRGPGTLPGDVVRALRAGGTIQGTCTPGGAAEKTAPICAASAAGYVVRVSEVFRLAGDTVQLYLTAERFRPARDTGGFQPPFRLEQRYGLVRRGGRWVVAQKGRMVR